MNDVTILFFFLSDLVAYSSQEMLFVFPEEVIVGPTSAL